MSYFTTQDQIFTYADFVQYTQDQLSAGRSTNEDNSPEYLHYSKLNLQRMQRVYKRLVMSEQAIASIKALPRQTWWVLTEGWCGDGAQILPLLQRLAEHNDDIEVKVLLRDKNLDIMDQYLTNGNRSIPMLIAATDQEQLAVWGPRPAGALQLALEYQENKEVIPFDEFEISMQQWYNKDAGESTIAEVLKALKAA